MPFSQIPGEAFDETDLKDVEKRGFGEHKEISGHLEKGSLLFFDKDSNRVVTLGRKGHLLRVHGSNEAIGGDPT